MATARILVVYFRALGPKEGARDSRAATVAHLALAAGLALGRLAIAAIGPLAAVDDDRHVRVVLVVLHHLGEELILELTRDHAIDHRSKCRAGFRLQACYFRDDTAVRIDP